MIIVLLVLHFITFKMFLCFNDEFTTDIFEFSVKEPDSTELRGKSSVYFAIKDDLKTAESEIGSVIVLPFLFLQFFSFLAIYKFLPYASWLVKDYVKIPLILSISVVGSLVIYFLHNHYSKVKPFDFEKAESEYNKSRCNYSFNDYIMLKHLDYLESIKNTVLFRAKISSNQYSFFLWILYVVLLIVN